MKRQVPYGEKIFTSYIADKGLVSVIETLRTRVIFFIFVNKANQLRLASFPGGSVVKNPPANAGDRGLIPDPGRFHMLQSNLACAL